MFSMGDVFILVCEMNSKSVFVYVEGYCTWKQATHFYNARTHLAPNLQSSFILSCKNVSVCMHAAHLVNAFVWNTSACKVFVRHFTNYLELSVLAQTKPSLGNTQEPLLRREDSGLL